MEHMLTVQDAIDAGCCTEGIDDFRGMDNEMSVTDALIRSHKARRCYVLRTILHKYALSVAFAYSCAESAAESARYAAEYARYAAEYAARSAAESAAEYAAESAARSAAESARYAAEYAESAAMDAAKSECTRQDKWILAHLPAEESQ